MSIDNRIVRVGITIDGVQTWYEDLWIEAKGVKITNTISSSCDITIIGLSSETRNYILRETMPSSPAAVRPSVELQVGRDSYGASTYYKGDVFRSQATPKPNLGIMLKCQNNYSNKGKMVSNSGKEITTLSTIAKTVATNNSLSLSFGITDKNIRSYSFTGSASEAIKHLEDLAGQGVDVYVDGDTLYLKNTNDKANGQVEYDVSDANKNLIQSTGTESGVKIRTMFDPSINIGSVINLDSALNPQLTGSYVAYSVEFHITSREQPYYLDIAGNLKSD